MDATRSLELLIIELGTSEQPFLEDYDALGERVTDCLVKEVWSRLHRFKIKLRLGNIDIVPPREGDDWFMNAVKKFGFSERELQIINRVQIHQEVLFESDAFGADGRQIDPQYLNLRRTSEKWSDVIFPVQFIPRNQLALWKAALTQLAPGGKRPRNIGKFIRRGHKIWNWRFNVAEEQLLYSASEGLEVHEYGRQNNTGRRSRQEIYVHRGEAQTNFEGHLCTTERMGDGSIRIHSHIAPPPAETTPNDFLEVLKEWGCTWLWKELKITNSSGSGVNIDLAGGGRWIRDAIEDGSLIGETDGSYIKQLCPHICSAAVIIECTRGRGLSFNKVWPGIGGQVEIYSDCLGALYKVEHLLPGKIPSRCRHSDILKNIMLHCNSLSFKRLFSHVKAHQDDHDDYENLERPAQLNSGCDYGAKDKLMRMALEEIPNQQPFPLEAISAFVDNHKLTTESSKQAKAVFEERKVLDGDAFERVDWPNVYKTLHNQPKMFQSFVYVWPVYSLEGVPIQGNTARVDGMAAGPRNAEGSDLFDSRIYSPTGEKRMEDICFRLPQQYKAFAKAQDEIGWSQFLEGMAAAELPCLLDNIEVERGGEIRRTAIDTGTDTQATGNHSRPLDQ
eukprot:scaffold60862_cov41-Cyclotella_meneghiniana.AAC.7